MAGYWEAEAVVRGIEGHRPLTGGDKKNVLSAYLGWQSPSHVVRSLSGPDGPAFNPDDRYQTGERIAEVAIIKMTRRISLQYVKSRLLHLNKVASKADAIVDYLMIRKKTLLKQMLDEEFEEATNAELDEIIDRYCRR